MGMSIEEARQIDQAKAEFIFTGHGQVECRDCKKIFVQCRCPNHIHVQKIVYADCLIASTDNSKATTAVEGDDRRRPLDGDGRERPAI